MDSRCILKVSHPPGFQNGAGVQCEENKINGDDTMNRMSFSETKRMAGINRFGEWKLRLVLDVDSLYCSKIEKHNIYHCNHF